MGYFGIPFRNGVPIGLGSVVSFGAQQFDPSELFVGGTAGAWYDPSDLTTLFTTSAGTTPVAMPGDGAAVSVGRMLDKSGNGNHAIAFNDTTARPELRARVNLLEYSEQFDNAYWFKLGLTITAGGSQITAPDGTTTADLVSVTAGSSTKLIRNSTFPAIAAGVQLTGTVCVKAGTHNFYSISITDTASGNKFAVATINLATGQVTKTGTGSGGGTIIGTPTCTSLGNGWFQVSLTATYPTGNAAVLWVCANSSATPTYNVGDYGAETWNAAGTETGYIWGADLRPANIGANVPAYQRIADANTYDTSGFPLYLRFDGIDDSMYTPANLNLSGTDKATVFAGVRRLTNTDGCVTELTSGTTNGLNLFASTIGGNSWFFSAWGASQLYGTAAPYTAPITNVLTEQLDKAALTDATRVSARVNAAAVSLSYTGFFGVPGNFANAPLYIGARGGNTIALNGHLHSLIIAGSAVSAGNISATEQWVANKTGIVIP